MSYYINKSFEIPKIDLPISDQLVLPSLPVQFNTSIVPKTPEYVPSIEPSFWPHTNFHNVFRHKTYTILEAIP